ncbi:MAG: hypothetical protein IH851_08335 [Armatimonadetes bacterium]|nr:hypothetical protein [Armatimonadota bacterium]
MDLSLLPALAVGLAAAVWFFESRGVAAPEAAEGPTPFWRQLAALRPILFASLFVAAAVRLASWRWNGTYGGLLPAATGFVLGAVAMLAADLADLLWGHRVPELRPSE